MNLIKELHIPRLHEGMWKVIQYRLVEGVVSILASASLGTYRFAYVQMREYNFNA